MLVALVGCGQPPPQVPRASTPESLSFATPSVSLSSSPIGQALENKPWIAHVASGDLDQDGLMDLLVCESRDNHIGWIRQIAPGEFVEQALDGDVQAPVHTQMVDMDADGDLDILVACMGEVFPNNARIGSVVILENDGAQNFTARIIAERVARVTDVRAGDFDGDGRLDLAVAHFGYDQGEVVWMQNRGDWQFDRHVLLNLSGAINVEVADMNGDRTLDIVTVVAQQWEEVYLFENQGHGSFTRKVIFASTNEDYGSSGIRLVDMNRDGRPDVLYSNGDGFDYAEPGSRPWHGVQWLENRGGGFFQFHRIGDLPGAYSPVAVDLNADGHLDVVACSGFNEWTQPGAVSLMAFLNDGKFGFTSQVLAEVPTHLMCLELANLDGAGKPPVIVSGGFHAYPPWDHLSRVTAWRLGAD
jgi:hypothetical protein